MLRIRAVSLMRPAIYDTVAGSDFGVSPAITLPSFGAMMCFLRCAAHTYNSVLICVAWIGMRR